MEKGQITRESGSYREEEVNERDRRARRAASRFGSDQFRPLSALESAWTSRKCNAFMRARHYACDIMRDCIATRQSSSRHVHPCSPLAVRIYESITTRGRGEEDPPACPCLNLKRIKPYIHPCITVALKRLFSSTRLITFASWTISDCLTTRRQLMRLDLLLQGEMIPFERVNYFCETGNTIHSFFLFRVE